MAKTIDNFMKFAVLAVLLLVPSVLRAEKEAYAEYSITESTLTFRYDDQRSSSKATATYDLPEPSVSPGWLSYKASVDKVIFDSSFAEVRPTSCYMWFLTMNYLESIEGIEYLNTSEVTDMTKMFSGCERLKSIDLSHFDTSKVTSMYDMFASCESLTSIDVSTFNTSEVTDMSDMFLRCSSIRYLDLTSFDTSNVEDMGYMFDGCTNLKGIFVGDGFTVSDECDGDEMFLYCYQLPGFSSGKTGTEMATADGYLTKIGDNCEAWAEYDDTAKSLTFHYDDQRSAATYGYLIDSATAFYPEWLTHRADITSVAFDKNFYYVHPSSLRTWFSSMTSLTDISGFRYLDTSAATDMAGMFLGCSALTGIDLSNFDTSAVTTMIDMFAGCTALKELDLTTFSTSAVKSMDEMFRDCTSLTTIYVHKSYVVADDCTGDNMFEGCTSLIDFDSAKIGKEMANYNGGYFTNKPVAWAAYQSDTKTLTIYYNTDKDSAEATAVYEVPSTWAEPGWINDYYNLSDIEKVVFDSSFAEARPTICEYWFGNMSSLTTIEGIEYFNTSCVTTMEALFYDCSKLTSVDLSHFDTSNVTSMKSMFQFCSTLTELDLSKFNTSKVANMDEMFDYCKGLTSLDLSNFNTSEVTTMSEMFEDCSGLTQINLSSFDTKKVTYMNDMFAGCSSLASLNLKNFDTSNVSSLSTMFGNCSSLKELDLSSFNTSSARSMSEMVSGCSGLTTLDLSTFDTSAVTTVRSMFDKCTSLKELDLSSFDLSNVSEAEYMFYGNSALEKIYVGEDFNFSNEGNYMFYGCTSLPNFSDSNIGGTMANYTTGYLTLRRHFSVGDTRYNIDGTDAVYDADVAFTEGNDFVSDCDFTLAADKTATFVHTDAAGWSVVCVPFAFNTESNAAADFYTISSVGESSVNLSLLSGTVAAGTPVIAFSRSNSFTITSATEAGIVKTPVDTDNLKGTFAAKTVDAGNYVLYNDKFQLASVVPQRTASGQLSPYSAYLTSDVAKDATLTINAEQTSGINTVEASDLLQLLDGAEFYDLQGRRLAEPPVKGIVIVKKGNESRKVIFE